MAGEDIAGFIIFYLLGAMFFGAIFYASYEDRYWGGNLGMAALGVGALWPILVPLGILLLLGMLLKWTLFNLPTVARGLWLTILFPFKVMLETVQFFVKVNQEAS
jgi:hypothetical protein